MLCGKTIIRGSGLLNIEKAGSGPVGLGGIIGRNSCNPGCIPIRAERKLQASEIALGKIDLDLPNRHAMS